MIGGLLVGAYFVSANPSLIGMTTGEDDEDVRLEGSVAEAELLERDGNLDAAAPPKDKKRLAKAAAEAAAAAAAAGAYEDYSSGGGSFELPTDPEAMARELLSARSALTSAQKLADERADEVRLYERMRG